MQRLCTHNVFISQYISSSTCNDFSFFSYGARFSKNVIYNRKLKSVEIFNSRFWVIDLHKLTTFDGTNVLIRIDFSGEMNQLHRSRYSIYSKLNMNYTTKPNFCYVVIFRKQKFFDFTQSDSKFNVNDSILIK